MKSCVHVVFGLFLLPIVASEARAQLALDRASPSFNQTRQSAGPGAAAWPEGARVGYVNLDRVAALSAEGKAAAAKLQDLRSRKAQEVSARDKEVETLQQKLSQAALDDVMRAKLQREFQRAQVNYQRFAEDAQREVQELQQQLSQAFNARVFPLVGEVAREKKLWAVFGGDSGLLWYDPGLDLSEELAQRLDKSVTPRR